MLTPLGKALRKLGIDKGWLLPEMAVVTDVAPSFLSTVEAGRKFRNGETAATRKNHSSLAPIPLRSGSSGSITGLTCRPRIERQQQLPARSFGSLPSDDIAKIREFILRRRT
jgi:hypothetical protein